MQNQTEELGKAAVSSRRKIRIGRMASTHKCVLALVQQKEELLKILKDDQLNKLKGECPLAVKTLDQLESNLQDRTEKALKCLKTTDKAMDDVKQQVNIRKSEQQKALFDFARIQEENNQLESDALSKVRALLSELEAGFERERAAKERADRTTKAKECAEEGVREVLDRLNSKHNVQKNVVSCYKDAHKRVVMFKHTTRKVIDDMNVKGLEQVELIFNYRYRMADIEWRVLGDMGVREHSCLQAMFERQIKNYEQERIQSALRRDELLEEGDPEELGTVLGRGPSHDMEDMVKKYTNLLNRIAKEKEQHQNIKLPFIHACEERRSTLDESMHKMIKNEDSPTEWMASNLAQLISYRKEFGSLTETNIDEAGIREKTESLLPPVAAVVVPSVAEQTRSLGYSRLQMSWNEVNNCTTSVVPCTEASVMIGNNDINNINNNINNNNNNNIINCHFDDTRSMSAEPIKGADII
eukprot:GHVR01077583.1.p1 GENE.GHVR01077583.1~~GHVR01077583.1.p1  ORF type:complete len:470 (-),score=151.15 GHVR01077583.1:210-1619(-)